MRVDEKFNGFSCLVFVHMQAVLAVHQLPSYSSSEKSVEQISVYLVFYKI